MDVMENIDIETIAAEIENCRKDVENVLAAINKIQDKLNLYREQIKEAEESHLFTGRLPDYTNTKPCSIGIESYQTEVRTWKDVLIEVCAYLNTNYREIFETFPNDKDMQGRRRKYFSRNNEGNAQQTQPVLIPNSEIYVETHFSANDLMSVIELMLEKCHILSKFRLETREAVNDAK